MTRTVCLKHFIAHIALKFRLSHIMFLILVINITSCSLTKRWTICGPENITYQPSLALPSEDNNTTKPPLRAVKVRKKIIRKKIPQLPVEKSADAADREFYETYSKKLGIAFDGTENKDLLMAVDEWLGTPYRWGGCSKDGVDCSCLVKSIYESVYGVILNRTSARIVNDDLTRVKKTELREGDILSFKMKDNRISHIGIYLKDNKFVHVSRKKGVKINDVRNTYYRKRFYAGGRVIRKLHQRQLAAASASRSVKRIRLSKLSIF